MVREVVVKDRIQDREVEIKALELGKIQEGEIPDGQITVETRMRAKQIQGVAKLILDVARIQDLWIKMVKIQDEDKNQETKLILDMEAAVALVKVLDQIQDKDKIQETKLIADMEAEVALAKVLELVLAQAELTVEIVDKPEQVKVLDQLVQLIQDLEVELVQAKVQVKPTPDMVDEQDQVKVLDQVKLTLDMAGAQAPADKVQDQVSAAVLVLALAPLTLVVATAVLMTDGIGNLSSS